MANSKIAAKRTQPSLRLISPPIYQLLSRLRNSIRRHVIAEGLAKMLIWLVVLFWATLAIDYLPVLFGFDELSIGARVIALGICAAGLIWIFYQSIFRCFFVRMKNESMAMLVERNYPAFNESLVTSVNYLRQEQESNTANQMRDHTRQVAEQIVPEVEIGGILKSRTVTRYWLLAGMLILSLIVLVFTNPSFARQAAVRLYQLDASPWPRRCNIELVGIKIARQNSVQGISELGQTVKPRDNGFKIARGDTVTLLVRAESESTVESNRELPENCRLIYRTAEGARGNLSMNRIGSPRDGFQLYAFDAQPFVGIISDIEFEFRGGDHRIGPFFLNVVDQPAVISTVLDCKFPNYMVDVESGRWTPREISWSGPTELPLGSSVTVKSTTNKKLRKVYLLDESTQQMETLEIDSNEFEIHVPFLSEPIKWEVYLCDHDGLVSEQPFLLSITPTSDRSPTIQNELVGIGTAITPNARIPVKGVINDDYRIGRSWIEVQTSNAAGFFQLLAVDAAGGFDAAVDFLEMQRNGQESLKLSTAPHTKVSLVVKAEDRFDLADQPNLGLGDKYTLDVVDSNQLLRILERKEVAERRRLEQIYLELVDARGYLLRTGSGYSERPTVIEPGDESGSDEMSDDKDPRQLEIRLLFGRRALMQVDKSMQELSGVVTAFENIRLQLINNRIDAKDRKLRIEQQVELPLINVVQKSMPSLRKAVVQLESNLTGLEQGLADWTLAQSDTATQLSISQIDLVLAELNGVLDSLVKYETQNELLEIVRRMIREQEDILEKTRQERQRKAFESLLD